RHHPASMSQDAMRMSRALISMCRGQLRSAPDAGTRALFAQRLVNARDDLHVLPLRSGMTVRGLLNGFALGLSSGRHRLSLRCLLGLALLPFLGRRRVVALLLEVGWSRWIRSYISF